MQTFLPYPNFSISAMSLDYRRLGKQRVEARQLQTTLQNGGGWASHPAALMWKDNLLALMLYGDVCIREWCRRGYENNMPLMFSIGSEDINEAMLNVEMPPWLGDEQFHAAHRSNLLRKDPVHYGQFDWDEPTDLEYIWPTT